jgi:hypothetical protein
VEGGGSSSVGDGLVWANDGSDGLSCADLADLLELGLLRGLPAFDVPLSGSAQELVGALRSCGEAPGAAGMGLQPAAGGALQETRLLVLAWQRVLTSAWARHSRSHCRLLEWQLAQCLLLVRGSGAVLQWLLVGSRPG